MANISQTPKPIEGASQPVSPVEAVISKYKLYDWIVVISPKDTINDLIAQKGKKLHFIQVLTPHQADNVKYHGEAKGTFIQNAFSNGATPIYARVAGRGSVCFEDANTASRVIVGTKKTIKAS